MRKVPFFLPFGGCRGRCVYCQQQTITGSSSCPTPGEVARSLEKLEEPAEVCFFGGSFCRFERSAVKAYLDSVVKYAPHGSRIRFSTYPGDLDDESLRRLVLSYPIARVELGIPSLDPAVLRACAREADPEAVLGSISSLVSDNVPLAVQMMIGLPGQTEASSLNDLRRIAEVKGGGSFELRLYPCLVLEGTELENMMNSGSYSPLSVERAADWGGRFLLESSDLGFVLIRAGLQESELLSSAVRGGPHYAALGELMLADCYARALVRNSESGPWFVPSRHISKFTGHNSFGIGRLALHSGKPRSEVKGLLRIF